MTVAEIYKGWRSSEEKSISGFFHYPYDHFPDLAIAEASRKILAGI